MLKAVPSFNAKCVLEYLPRRGLQPNPRAYRIAAPVLMAADVFSSRIPQEQPTGPELTAAGLGPVRE